MASFRFLKARSRLVVVAPSFSAPLGAALRRGFAYQSAQRHKRFLKYAKGYRGRSKNCFAIAIRRIEKAWQYAYRDRRAKKREWRKLWIQRFGAAGRQYGINYSTLIAQQRYSNVQLNRKVLSELAATEPFAFKSVIDVLNVQKASYEHQQQQQQQEPQQEVA